MTGCDECTSSSCARPSTSTWTYDPPNATGRLASRTGGGLALLAAGWRGKIIAHSQGTLTVVNAVTHFGLDASVTQLELRSPSLPRWRATRAPWRDIRAALVRRGERLGAFGQPGEVGIGLLGYPLRLLRASRERTARCPMRVWLRTGCLLTACALLSGCWYYQRFVESQQMADYDTDESGRRVFADTPRNWGNMVRRIEPIIALEVAGRRPFDYEASGHDSWRESWTSWMGRWTDGGNAMSEKLVAYVVERRRQEGLRPLDDEWTMPQEYREKPAYSAGMEPRFSDERVRALVVAARDGDIQRIDRLVAEGADPNARGPGGVTPLYLTVNMGRGDVRGFVRLLEHGADPNVLVDDDGTTVMHWSVGGMKPDRLLAALRHSGDVNVRDAWGDTPLSSTDRLLGIWPDLLSALLDAPGLDIEAPNRDGTTVAMKVAGLRDDILYELLVRGADYERRNAAGYSVLDRLAFQGQFKYAGTPGQRLFEKVVAWLGERGVELPPPRSVLAAWDNDGWR